MGKSLLSMTRLQNALHLSIGKKDFWGVVYQQCHEGGLFFPLNLDEYACVHCMIITIMPARRLAELLLE